MSISACTPTKVAPPSEPPEPETPAVAEVREQKPAVVDAPPPHEPSVRPGINDSWRSADVDPLIENLEADEREIVRFKTKIIAASGVREGDAIADVGSGSGLLTVELARATGPSGKVFAVDINEALLARVDSRVRAAGLGNVETVLSPDDAVALQDGSIDLVFLCDTYHHFEYPKTMLAELRRTLREGGRLVVVDFERIPGKSEGWILDHVRAPKEVFRAEIEAAGFRVREETKIPGMEQNFMIVFER